MYSNLRTFDLCDSIFDTTSGLKSRLTYKKSRFLIFRKKIRIENFLSRLDRAPPKTYNGAIKSILRHTPRLQYMVKVSLYKHTNEGHAAAWPGRRKRLQNWPRQSHRKALPLTRAGGLPGQLPAQ